MLKFLPSVATDITPHFVLQSISQCHWVLVACDFNPSSYWRCQSYYYSHYTRPVFRLTLRDLHQWASSSELFLRQRIALSFILISQFLTQFSTSTALILFLTLIDNFLHCTVHKPYRFDLPFDFCLQKSAKFSDRHQIGWFTFCEPWYFLSNFPFISISLIIPPWCQLLILVYCLLPTQFFQLSIFPSLKVFKLLCSVSTSDVVISISINYCALSSYLTLILTECDRRSRFHFGAKLKVV